jgi:hypothetical protein
MPRIAAGAYEAAFGDILSHTVSPLISRATWPLMMAKIFGPRSVPRKFEAFPKEMAVCTEKLNPDVVAMKSAKDRI